MLFYWVSGQLFVFPHIMLWIIYIFPVKYLLYFFHLKLLIHIFFDIIYINIFLKFSGVIYTLLITLLITYIGGFILMNDEIIKLWEGARKILQEELSKVTYETLIVELVPTLLKEGDIYLKSRASFLKETIEMRYMESITKAIKSASGKDYRIHIVTSSDAIVVTSGSSIESASNLVKKYNFDSFVTAKSNHLAYATAVAVAQNPGTTTYNPLFLYGGVGLGKTHLMHAIGNLVKESNPAAKVLYCSTETFMNELVFSIQNGKNEEFRSKYRATDVLLIDDIQFLSEKERTQEEFFHTFNILRDANKQIVISSDKPPRDIATLEERLVSRFGQGIIVDLQIPDFETRIAILEKKAQSDNIHVPKEVIMFIAENFYSNIRDLEGALNKVIAYAKLLNQPVSSELTRNALKDLLTRREKPVIDIPSIQAVVSTHYGITVEDITGKKRTKNIAFPRQVAMYLCRKLLDTPLTNIGNSFGGRDHSTVIHGCDKIAEELEKNPDFKNTLSAIEDIIEGN